MSKTEYDFTKAEPIEFEDIRKGMLIMHHDTDRGKFYSGIAADRRIGLWENVDGEYVADNAFQNYHIPEKPKPLPTHKGSRIRLIDDHPCASNLPGVTGDKAGACFTLSRHTGNWVLDGHSDSRSPEWFEDAKWEEVFVTNVKPS